MLSKNLRKSIPFLISILLRDTQNEGDSVHSTIEKQIRRSLKSRPIYIPDQYAELIRVARKQGDPFMVHQFDHSHFLAIKQMTTKLGLKWNRIKISSVKVWKITRDVPEVFQFKTSYSQELFENVNLGKEKKQTRKSVKINVKTGVLPKLGILYKKPILLKEN